MKLKTVSVEQLALETGKVLRDAHKHAVVVRGAGKGDLVIRPLVDDDTADELLVRSRSFRSTIRQARQRRKLGKGVPLAEARRQLKA